MEKLTDKSPLPIKGPYYGEAMANVPADYLLHLRFRNNLDPHVLTYVNDNVDVLENELTQLQANEQTPEENEF